MLRTSRVLLALTMLGFLAPIAYAAEHSSESLQTVKTNITEKKAVLVDVREKSEWNQGHVAGAILLPLSTLQNGITAEVLQSYIPKGAVVYTHCAIGRRSLTAAGILLKFGYDVRALKAGYTDLLQAGFPKGS